MRIDTIYLSYVLTFINYLTFLYYSYYLLSQSYIVSRPTPLLVGLFLFYINTYNDQMTLFNPFKEYNKYAQDVVNGDILACNAIKLQCERYLSWFERDDMYFDYDDVEEDQELMEYLKQENYDDLEIDDEFIEALDNSPTYKRTMIELEKIEKVRRFLIAEGIVDNEGCIDYISEL